MIQKVYMWHLSVRSQRQSWKQRLALYCLNEKVPSIINRVMPKKDPQVEIFGSVFCESMISHKPLEEKRPTIYENKTKRKHYDENGFKKCFKCLTDLQKLVVLGKYVHDISVLWGQITHYFRK